MRSMKAPADGKAAVKSANKSSSVVYESQAAAALKSFSQVYAMNIDYRDVAERISALQKPIR